MEFFVVGLAAVCLAAFVLALMPPSKVGAFATLIRYAAAGFLIAIGLLLEARGILAGLILVAAGGYVLVRQRNRRISSAGTSTRAGPMGVDEAYAVLGLAAGASELDIKRAHHDLMQKIHPDHGGTSYLAAKLNQARDILLDQMRR
jgi:DnaJ domain